MPHLAAPAGTRGRLVSRPEIVAAALAVSRRVGVGGLTMRGVADELGVSVATAYYHVPSKADLLAMVAVAVLGEIEVPAPGSGPWDARLRALEDSARATFRRYPGLVGHVPHADPVTDGAELRDAVLDILRDAGLRNEALRGAYVCVYTYVMGQLHVDGAIASGEGRRVALHLDPQAAAPVAPGDADSDAAFHLGFDVIVAGITATATATATER